MLSPLFSYSYAIQSYPEERFDLVFYAISKRWPSFSYWIVPGTYNVDGENDD